MAIVRRLFYFMALLPLTIVFVSTFMHAGWNLLARSQQDRDIFLPVLVVVAGLATGPALVAEWVGEPVLTAVYPYLFLTALFETLYYLGLLRGYQSGDFTVVYPVARALPVLLLALVDVVQGQPPSWWGWLGMVCISLGCLLIPLRSPQDFTWARYGNAMMGWVLLAALGTVGYTLVDRAAAGQLAAGWQTAVRYGAWMYVLTAVGYWLILKWLKLPAVPLPQRANWGHVLLAALAMFSAYALILWAYQLAARVSYIVALRQFSIVLGVIGGIVLFHEPAPRWRLTMALLIVLGITLIAVWG